MQPVVFDDLERLPLLHRYAEAFQKATGVPLKLVPPGEAAQRLSFGRCDSPFCNLISTIPTGCATCVATHQRVQRNAATKLAAQQVYCFAGLTVVAVPVVIALRHVATITSGQVFRREPTERDFMLVAKMLNGAWSSEEEKMARKAYFETPVITAERFEAIIQMLNLFAQYVAAYAGRPAMATASSEPSAVAGAKEYIRGHLEESISLQQVIQHVHVSRFYFCKLFKKTTGMTLTEYVARARLERAKELLVDPSLRVSEIAFASGFGSIPQFNSVFKRSVGMPPTEYRAALKRRLPLV